MTAAPQVVEVVDTSPGWVEFVDDNGLAGMDWDTARLLHRTARNNDSGRVFSTELHRWFDRDVLGFVVETIDRQPTCPRVVDGRSACEQPSDPMSRAGWCADCSGGA